MASGRTPIIGLDNYTAPHPLTITDVLSDIISL